MVSIDDAAMLFLDLFATAAWGPVFFAEGMPGEFLMISIVFTPIPKIACVVVAPT